MKIVTPSSKTDRRDSDNKKEFKNQLKMFQVTHFGKGFDPL